MLPVMPLYDRVLIKVLDSEERKHGSIIIPPSIKGSERNMVMGEVVRVGHGVNQEGKQTEMQLKCGDRVWVNRFSGCEITHESGNYVLMREYEVFGKEIQE